MQVGQRIAMTRSNSPSLICHDEDKPEGIKAALARTYERSPPVRPTGALSLRPRPTLSSPSGEFSLPRRRSAKRKRVKCDPKSFNESSPQLRKRHKYTSSAQSEHNATVGTSVNESASVDGAGLSSERPQLWPTKCEHMCLQCVLQSAVE